MVRDMDLVRAILFALEKKENTNTTFGLAVQGYQGEIVPYHCKMMYEAGLIDFYKEMRVGSGDLYHFQIGNLSWSGQDYLDKIRADTVWNKTKDVIKSKGLPMILDVVKDVSTAIIQSMTQGAIKGLLGQG